MPRKKADEPKLTLEKILSTAYELFAREGYEGTTLNELAKVLNVSKPALYYYFSSKEALFEALYQSIAELVQSDLEQVLIGARASFSKGPCDREAFKEIIYQLGINDFEGLSSDPNLAKVLRQFDLLSLRRVNIDVIAHNLADYTIEVYGKIFDLALEANIFSRKEVANLKPIITALINGFNYELIFEQHQVDLKTWRFALDRLL